MGFRVEDLEFIVGLSFRALCSGLRVHGSSFRVWGFGMFGFRVSG